MAWPKPVRRTFKSNTRSRWGYTFEWTSEHLSPEQLDPLKYTYDVLADECLDELNAISASLKSKGQDEQMNDAGQANGKHDLYNMLREHSSDNAPLRQLWTQVNTVPDWVDWEQIARGQEVFYRYGGPALTGLAFQSLLGGMGAHRIVETLVRTGGFSAKSARRRMFETTQHILQCTSSVDSLKPGGPGHVSSIRVRLLHAAVRQRILKLMEKKQDYYNVESWGIPVSDLDCIATIGTFSATLIWLSFPRQGIWLRSQEIKDYIALWRFIAYLVGTPTDHFETPRKARTMMESLLFSEIEPTYTSKFLANNIIKSLEGQPPGYPSKEFLQVQARWLNGGELADRLGIPRPGLWYWALMAGQCIFFCSICYTYRSIPYLDRKKISALRRVFYAIIVKHEEGLGEETTFQFKYIPQMSTLKSTEDGSDVHHRRYSGIERRNLRTLLYTFFLLALLVFGLEKLISIARRRSW